MSSAFFYRNWSWGPPCDANGMSSTWQIRTSLEPRHIGAALHWEHNSSGLAVVLSIGLVDVLLTGPPLRTRPDRHGPGGWRWRRGAVEAAVSRHVFGLLFEWSVRSVWRLTVGPIVIARVR